jgi:cell wall-associated NlpC family hydrolase
VTDTTPHQALATGWRGRVGLSRRALIAILLAAGLGALAAALAVGAGSHHAAGATHKSAHGAVALSLPAAARQAGAGASVAATSRAKIPQVRDPTEASSYPAPASVHHAAAATPTKAGEAIVAAGAPSDAEVRAELQQMQAAERSARRTQQQRLAPVAGGHSIGGDGTIPIPPNAPEVVQRVIAGANAIADFPYVFGGGHGSFVDNAYDCSGSVSYALAAGGLLGAPQTSGELASWGVPGPGRYITVLANAGHTYMYVDGVMYNTAGRSGVYASRWQASAVDNGGYVARHWPGL